MPQKKNINRRHFLRRATGAVVGTIGFGLGHRLSPRQHIHAAWAKFEMGPGEGTLS